ncbi:MAG: DUF4391 domain-containing protein [Proteobacteria bacterium]|nr:DUF4391 domain-containing protein [Pseudomonadota bacterium]
MPDHFTSHPSLFTFPKSSAFGKVLPKAKLYEHGSVGTRLKGLFTEQVEQIVWQYKLAPETINLPASPGVPEIQVFSVRLRAPELHHDVLRGMDSAIAFPILFELNFEDRIQVVAAYKRPSEADASRWVRSDYFASEWLPTSSPRKAMPTALSLGNLYQQVLSALIALPARPSESLPALVERASQVQALRHELHKVVSRLEKEKQFNRRVEINASVRELKHNLKLLEG